MVHSDVKMLQNRLLMLTNIQKGSMAAQYQAMFNQCVVLLVSYFDSALHTLFRQGVATALAAGAEVPAAEENLKISWRTVSEAEGDREFLFADLLISQHDISFQDMKSIGRAFKEQLKIEIPRIPETNNVILGQAARHALVHAGGIVDPIMVRQVENAKPRTLMTKVIPESVIRFSPEEVRTLSTSMSAYVQRVVQLLDHSVARWNA
jgi:hypothetical protein